MKPLKTGEIALEDGSFNLCVTLTPATIEELTRDLKSLHEYEFSLLEWRADYLSSTSGLSESVKKGIHLIKENFPSKPLIFTYRSKEEGGKTSLDPRDLFRIRKQVIEQNKAEIIDFELYWFKEEQSEEFQNEYPDLLERAKELGIKILLSWHDFKETPEAEALLDILTAQERAGADLAKITAYARTNSDLDTLMNVSFKASKVLQIPHIAISMGNLGEQSRYDRENSKSCVTFAPLKTPSAPGQLSLLELQEKLHAAQ